MMKKCNTDDVLRRRRKSPEEEQKSKEEQEKGVTLDPFDSFIFQDENTQGPELTDA